MNFRSPFCLLLLASALLSATAVSAGDEQALAWLETEASILEQINAEHAAGEDDALRGGITAIHGLIRRQILNGDYSDLPPQDAPNGPEFGYSVAIDGDWLAVGAPGTIRAQTLTGLVGEWGAVFLFQREGGTWMLRHRFLGGVGSEPERCGHAVALQMPYLVIGCPNSSSEPYPETGRWRAFHVTSDALTNGHGGSFQATAAIGAKCGSAVAISANYLVYGCPNWAPDGDDGEGRAYVFRRADASSTFTFESSVRAPANAFRFGAALALRQPPLITFGEPGYVRLAIGAPNTVYAGSIWPRGSAFVYRRWADTTWSQSVVLRPAPPGSDGAEFARYGEAVAMNRNQLLVGAPNNRYGSVNTLPGPGTAHRHVLTEVLGDWSWQATESSGPVNLPGGADNEQRFGAALALGFDNLIAVGAPGTTSTSGVRPEVGLSEIRRTGSGDWGLHAYWGELRPAGDTPTHNNAHFGTSLAFDVPGRTLAVGVPGLRILSGPFAPRGQVWLYTEDYLFDNDFECAAGLPGC